jgi:hypothetical protein
VQEYIQRWFLNEILYREALRQGVDKEEPVKRRTADAQRQIIINAFLEKEVYKSQMSEPTQTQLEAYYNEHKNNFLLTSDVVLVSYGLFKDRESATTFRNDVLQRSTWRNALEHSRSSLILKVDSAYYTQSTLFPQELWRVATSFRKEEPSFPISTQGGFFVLIAWKYMQKGSLPDLNYVRGEITNRLLQEHRRAAYDTLIAQLRTRYTMEMLADPSKLSGK